MQYFSLCLVRLLIVHFKMYILFFNHFYSMYFNILDRFLLCLFVSWKCGFLYANYLHGLLRTCLWHLKFPFYEVAGLC